MDTDVRTMMTVAHVARVCAVHAGTVRRWIRDGRLPAHRVGPRVVRVDPADLNVLIRRAGGGR